MQICWKSVMFTLMLNFCLISHGQGVETSSTSVPYKLSKSFSAPLNGNWHLTGVHYLWMGARLPFISFAIITDGDQIKGRGNLLVGCQNNSQGGNGGSGWLTGTIAPDGTFEADNYKTLSHVQISIHGTVPQSGDRSWQGTYTLKNRATEPDCIVDESGAFTATRYPPFTGTYSGTFTDSNAGASVAVTLQVTQGEPGDYSTLGFSIPLGGKITVSGLRCFNHGTATEKRDNEVRGDEFWLTFSMEDGALFHLDGNRFMEDSGDSTIKNVSMVVEGGRCQWAAELVLFRLDN